MKINETKINETKLKFKLKLINFNQLDITYLSNWLFAMADLFQRQGRAASPVPSEVEEVQRGESSRVPEGAAESAKSYGAKGVYRSDGKAAALKGRSVVGYDPRKFSYDVVRGKRDALPFSASKDDRMSATEAGDMLDRLHRVFGIENETEGVLRGFDRGLFFCHTVNGGSTLAPGRSTFSVLGVTESFSFAKVRDVLGVDQRRFFRAFADEITEVNKSVCREYDPYDVVKAEHWGWLQQVAHDRGLHRYPYLSHDSADACLLLSPPERVALAASKVLVIASTANSADRLKANSRVMSADSYDSTAGERL